MKIKKIIYFVVLPFCQRDYERFGIEIMRNNGFYVEIWDFTPVFNNKLFKTFKIPDPIDYEISNCRLILNKKEAIRDIKNLEKNSLVITMFGMDYRTYFLYRELSKSNILYALFYANNVPMYINTCSRSKSTFVNNFVTFLNKIKKINFAKIKKHLFMRIPFGCLMLKLPSFILAGGSQTLINFKAPIGKDTKIVWGHALDYDLYLKDLNKSPNNEFKDKKYALFIDQYRPFHPNYIRRNEKPPTSPNNYYPILNDFFSKVEKETGLDVVIAAHPRSKYEEHPDYFKDRKVIRGKTKELIRDSEIVLMHYSTSLNFAVLYHKPVIFITTNEMEQSIMDAKYIRSFSSEFNKKFININSNYEIDWQKELKINEEVYSRYKEKYIKRRNTKEDFFWQIVADEIRNYY